MRRWLVLGSMVLATGLVIGGPVSADRLVMKDGAVISTVGTWEVKGRLVVFQQSDGILGSVRATEVDFAKSAEATTVANAPAPPPAPPPVRKPSVMSLTEKDLPPVGEGGTASAPALGSTSAPAPALVVLPNWRTVAAPDGQSTELLGVVRNDSKQAALGVQVVAVLISSEGEILAEIEGATSSRAIQPGQTTSFRVGFENGQPYERIEFRVNGEFGPLPSGATPPGDQGAEVEAETVAENPDGV